MEIFYPKALDILAFVCNLTIIISEYRISVEYLRLLGEIGNNNGMNTSLTIVGAGPSGLLAALAASEKFNNITLFNKNPRPGKKISAIPAEDLYFSESLPPKKMALKFGEKAEFVEPIFREFNHDKLTKYLKKANINLQQDKQGSYRANGLAGEALSQLLLEEILKRGVKYRKSSRVTDIVVENGQIAGVIVNGSMFPASSVIIATGSFSSPKYGATRDGYEMSKRLGHTINEIKPALVDLITIEKYGKTLAGETINDVRISIFFDGKQAYSDIGTIKFTNTGISGPCILDHSGEMIDKLAYGSVEVRLDFMPNENRETFEAWLIKQFISQQHILIGQFLNRYLDENAIKAVQLESRIKLDKSILHITNLERKSLIHAIKDFRLTIKAHKPFNNTRGVIGGVATTEIDPKTLQSNLVNSLYFAGDVIDVLGPYGGYNMQFAFSSGYIAGHTAANNLN